MIKSLTKVGIERTYLNLIKTIYDKSTANVILNSEKLKDFLIRYGARQGSSLLPLIFSVLLEVLATTIR